MVTCSVVLTFESVDFGSTFAWYHLFFQYFDVWHSWELNSIEKGVGDKIQNRGGGR